MKKLLFAVSALAALSLLASSVGFATTAPNQLGIYTEQTGFTSNIDGIGAGEQFNAYLVLTNPINEDFDDTGLSEPITAIDGFECAVIMPEGLNFLPLQAIFPPQALNIGTAPDYVVGFASPVPVVDNAVTLITWLFANIDGGEYNIYLGPTSVPRLPGLMSIVDTNDSDSVPSQPIYPVSEDGTSLPEFLNRRTRSVNK